MATYTSGTGVGSGYANKDAVETMAQWFVTPALAKSGILVAAFIFGVVRRKLWFAVDLIATTVFALAWYLCPQSLLGFQVSRQQLDGVDLQLGRMIGAVLAGSSVLWFFLTKRSRDPDTVHPALLLTRVITNGVLMIAMIDIQLFSKAWAFEHMTFGFLGVLLWTIGNLVHLVLGGYPGGHLQRYRPINNYLLREFAVSVFLGFTMYGFPRWFLRNFTLIRTLDGVHEHLTRAFGALIFGTGVFAFQAVGFMDERDKEAHFLERLVINVLLMASTAYAQFLYFKEWNLVHSWAIQFALILWSIHAYLGWNAETPYRPIVGVGRKVVGRERITERTYASSALASGDALRHRDLGTRELDFEE